MGELNNLKMVKLSELAFSAQSFVNGAVELDVVPQFERDTWPMQAAEAEAWARDKRVKTPVLDVIALRTGDEREQLIKKVLKKARLYTVLAADVSGQRQAYARRINEALSVDELDGISFTFVLPEGWDA